MNGSAIVKIVGLEAAMKHLENAERGIKQTETAFRRSLVVLDRWVQKNFQTEGGNVGGWVPLSDTTVDMRMRRRNKTGMIRILQDNGKLRQQWEHESDEKHATLRSKVDYGIFHDSDEPRSKLPQRRIMPRMREAWDMIKPLFSEHIQKAIERRIV